MGVAALVLGIISIIMSCIPFCNYFFIIPALVGVILGICDVVSKRKKGGKKGIGIAGMILSILSIVIIIVVTLLIAFGVVALNDIYNESLTNSIYYNNII